MCMSIESTCDFLLVIFSDSRDFLGGLAAIFFATYSRLSLDICAARQRRLSKIFAAGSRLSRRLRGLATVVNLPLKEAKRHPLLGGETSRGELTKGRNFRESSETYIIRPNFSVF